MSDDGDGPAADDPAGTAEHDDGSRGDDAPLSELAERINRQRTDRSGDDAAEPPDFDPEVSEEPPAPDDDPFDRMSVGEIDEETLWSSLGSEESVGVGVDVDADAGGSSLGDVEPDPEVESVDDGSAAQEHVVPKDKYCQSCPYLAAPPELRCTNEGTEIVAVVDSERFRVRNCPMVEGGVEPQE
jgi:hypothetical protein